MKPSAIETPPPAAPVVPPTAWGKATLLVLVPAAVLAGLMAAASLLIRPDGEGFADDPDGAALVGNYCLGRGPRSPMVLDIREEESRPGSGEVVLRVRVLPGGVTFGAGRSNAVLEVPGERLSDGRLRFQAFERLEPAQGGGLRTWVGVAGGGTATLRCSVEGGSGQPPPEKEYHLFRAPRLLPNF
jgi:hypothetical protein